MSRRPAPSIRETVDVAKERDRVLWKRRVDARARVALRRAGWDATPGELKEAIAADPLLEDDDERRTETLRWQVLQRALELQADPAHRGRRLTPQEVRMAQGTDEGIDRDAVREYIGRRRRQMPVPTILQLQQECEERFGLKVSKSAFYSTYYVKAKLVVAADAQAATAEAEATEPTAAAEAWDEGPEAWRAAATSEEAEVKASAPEPEPEAEAADVPEPAAAEVPEPPLAVAEPAPTPAVQPAAEDRPPAPQPAPVREVPSAGSPFLQMLPLDNGTVRVRIDIALEFRAASHLVHLASAALAQAGGAR